MMIKKMGLLSLVLISSIQLFAIPQRAFQLAVGASVALTASFSGAKVWQGYSEDGMRLSDNDKNAIAASLMLPLATYGLLRGRTPAGRLRAVTAHLNKMSKHRFVTQSPDEHVNRHSVLQRLLSLEQEGLKHTSDLEGMRAQLLKAHTDAKADEDHELCKQIKDGQYKVKEYQENVAANLGATLQLINAL